MIGCRTHTERTRLENEDDRRVRVCMSRGR